MKKDMDYSKLGNDLVKLEKLEEKKEENVATSSTTEDVKTNIRGMSEGEKASSRVVTTLVRKALCNVISRGSSRWLGWKMEGYTERVDNDPVVVDAFHTVSEKRIPKIIVHSPEITTVVGLGSHAYATHVSNSALAKSAKEFNDTVPVKVEDETVYATEEDFPIDIAVHASQTTSSIPGKTVVDIDVDDFGFKNQDGEFVEAPRSVMDSLFTGRKRPNRTTPPVKRVYKKRKLNETSLSADDNFPGKEYEEFE